MATIDWFLRRVAKWSHPTFRACGMALAEHFSRLAAGPATPSAASAVVVGAGLTGIEAASELPERLGAMVAARSVPSRVVLIDHNPWVGSDMGESARPVIESALSDNG